MSLLLRNDTSTSYDILVTEAMEQEIRHQPLPSNFQRKIPGELAALRFTSPLATKNAQYKGRSLTHVKITPSAKCNLLMRKRNGSGSGPLGHKPEILDDESILSCTESRLSTLPAD